MRTHTAPWDMRQPRPTTFPLNDTCPKCGKACNSTVVVSEKLYFCESCGTVKVELALMDAVRAIRQEWEASGILFKMTRREDDLLLAYDEQYTKEINRPM